jgi:hypothetical protein
MLLAYFFTWVLVIVKKLLLEGMVKNIASHCPIKTIVAKFAKLFFRQNFNLSHDSKDYVKYFFSTAQISTSM